MASAVVSPSDVVSAARSRVTSTVLVRPGRSTAVAASCALAIASPAWTPASVSAKAASERLAEMPLSATRAVVSPTLCTDSAVSDPPVGDPPVMLSLDRITRESPAPAKNARS